MAEPRSAQVAGGIRTCSLGGQTFRVAGTSLGIIAEFEEWVRDTMYATASRRAQKLYDEAATAQPANAARLKRAADRMLSIATRETTGISWGDPVVMNAAMTSEGLMVLAAAVLRSEHPDITPQAIMELRPTRTELSRLVGAALELAGLATTVDDETPDAAASDGEKKGE